MTTLSANILFNNSGSSDTAASGVGPATAVSGTGASTNNTTTVDLTADTPDLSGVSAGDLMWVGSSSLRQFSVIASVNDGADTLVTDDIFTLTEGSLNWGIGGKRNSLQTSINLLNDDIKADWTVEFESGYTDTISTAISIDISGGSASGINIIGTDGAATRPVLTYSSSGTFITYSNQNGWRWAGLDFENTNGSPGACFTSTDSVPTTFNQTIEDCRCISATNEFSSFISSGGNAKWFISHSEIANTSGDGIFASDSSAFVLLDYCTVRDSGSNGVNVGSVALTCRNSIISNNAGSGLRGTALIEDCSGNIIYNNSGDGIVGGVIHSMQNNIIVSNTGAAINTSARTHLTDYNAYYNNGSEVADQGAGPNDITLTADPFENAALGDFNINAVAGGGAVLRGTKIILPSS